MKPTIDIFLFEKYFQLFVDLVEQKSKMKFVSFSGNEYTQDNEGYKDEIYDEARDKLQYWKWKKENIGKGIIFKKVVSSIKFKGNKNNLVDWRLVSKFEEKARYCNHIACWGYNLLLRA